MFSLRERRPSRKSFEDAKGLTEQSHKDSCDMRNILQKAQKNGTLEHLQAHRGTYGEYPTADQFKQHMDLIAKANQMFQSVPSEIRKKFDNDMGQFVDFMQNNENYHAISEMGLDNSHLTKPEPAPAEPAPEPAPSAE